MFRFLNLKHEHIIFFRCSSPGCQKFAQKLANISRYKSVDIEELCPRQRPYDLFPLNFIKNSRHPISTKFDENYSAMKKAFYCLDNEDNENQLHVSSQSTNDRNISYLKTDLMRSTNSSSEAILMRNNVGSALSYETFIANKSHLLRCISNAGNARIFHGPVSWCPIHHSVTSIPHSFPFIAHRQQFRDRHCFSSLSLLYHSSQENLSNSSSIRSLQTDANSGPINRLENREMIAVCSTNTNISEYDIRSGIIRKSAKSGELNRSFIFIFKENKRRLLSNSSKNDFLSLLFLYHW